MSKYNVSDMKGAPIPDEVIEDWEKWANERPVSWEHLRTYLAKTKDETGFAMPRSLRPNVMVAGVPDKVDEVTPEVTDPYVKAVDLVHDLMEETVLDNGIMADIEAALRGYIERATNIAINMHMVNAKEEAVAKALGAKWDLRDEDGDLHSPSWYIEAFTSANASYMEIYRRDIDAMTPEQEANHMAALDDALLEAEMYERYVNKLFGYSDE